MRVHVLAASSALFFSVAAAAYADCSSTPNNCTIAANGTLHADSGPNNTAGQIYSQTFTVQNMSGLISGVKITLGNWNLGTTYPSSSGFLGDFFFELISPGGQAFDFWGEPNQACVESLSPTFTITIQDGGTLIPDGCSNPQNNSDGYYHISNNATYAPVVSAGPPGATPACSDPSGSHSGVKCPAQLSNATFASAFGGATPNGTWTIYSKDFSIDDNGNGIQALTMTITTHVASQTTTSLSDGGVSQLFTASPGNTVTLTATVTSSSTVNEGTVEFLDNGNAISGCSSVTVSNGSATCSPYSSSTEGVHVLTASYTDSGGSFGNSDSSSAPVDIFLDHHTVVTSSNGTTTFCNPGTISLTNNGAVTTTQPYPQHVFVSGLTGSLATLTLTLNNITITGNNSFSGLDMLLEAPDGTSYVPLAEVGSVNDGGVSNLTFSIADSGATMMANGSVSGSANPSANTTYKPSDYNASLSFFNAGSTTILDSPPASGYNLPPMKGSASLNATFASQNLDNASNPWSLYVADDTGVYTATIGGYCLAFTTGTSTPSTTTVTANPNPATIPIGSTTTTVTLNAHVTANGSPVTTGTVTFFSNGTQVGTAQNLDSSGNASVQLQNATEGAYAIGANYSGVQAQFTASQSLPYSLEIDDATVETDNPNQVANFYTYCNPATISLPGGDTLPLNYPSRVFITDAPGTLLKLGVTLDAVTFTQHYMEAMLVGPGGPTNNIIFWANIGSDPGSSLSNENFTIEDGASNGPLPSTGSISAGTFSPASYSGTSSILFTCINTTCAQNSAPPPQADWNFATTLGTTTFAREFPAGNDPNGTFQFFVYHNVAGTGWSVGEHCVNMTVTPPVVAVAVSPSPTATFTQGDTADTYTITVTNSGPGKTGTKNALTVTDTLPSGLHVVSMAETANTSGGGLADWTCNTGTVTCSRSTPMPAGETDTITLTVSVDYTQHGSGFTNSVALCSPSIPACGGIDTSNPANLTATDSTTINPGPVSVRFDTSPGSLQLSVNGSTLTAPQTVTVTNYTTVTNVSAVTPQFPSTGTQETFNSWSNSGAQNNFSISCSSTTTTCSVSYTASFDTSYQLTTAVNPANSGTVSPASGSYFPANSSQPIVATANTGWGFANWTGSTVANATSASTTITMSAPESVTANFKANTTTTVTSSQNPSVFGQSVTFTATVSPVPSGLGTTPSGTVTFLDGGAPIGMGTLSGGIATFATSALAVASHTITTSYNGDANFNGSTGSLTNNPQVVNKANTGTAVTSTVNPSVFGQSVTFTATVAASAPGAGNPTGTVTFFDGSNQIGTGTLSGGIATFSTSALAVASHTITATYNADSNFNGSTGSLTGNPQVVNKANTGTTVASSVNPSVFGQSVTFTATITASAPGAGTPTGTVAFLDGGSQIGTGTLSGGIATFSTSALAVASHTITTSYQGDGNFNGSTGSLTPTPTQVVNKGNTATTVTSSANPSNLRQSVTFTATLSAVLPAAGTPTGSVTFLDGGSMIGSGTLVGGVATFSTSGLGGGSHTITTSYAGDGNFNGSTGSLTPTPTQVVNKGNTTTVVTSSANPAAFGQPVTFTATVSAVSPATGTPTGTVTFLDGGLAIGTPAPLNSSGVATLTTSTLAVGSHTISATYNADTNFGGSSGSLTGNPQVIYSILGNTVAVTETGILYSPLLANPGGGGSSPGGGTTTFIVTNTSGSAIIGPIQLALTNLPSGVTGANNTGTFQGNPYWTVSLTNNQLTAGASATVVVQLNYAAGTAVSTTPATYMGSLQ